MKTQKHLIQRMMSVMLAVLLTLAAIPALAAAVPALTAANPAIAANQDVNTENLKITIHNNDGLPAMTEDQFEVYQLFTGTPHVENPAYPDAPENEWDANHWYDYTLADIQWGSSVSEDVQKALITALKGLNPDEQHWLGKNNPFENLSDTEPLSSAADVAVLLEGKNSTFMQGFASWLLSAKDTDSFSLTPVKGDDGTNLKGTVVKGATPADDTLTYSVPCAGYYLLAENAAEHTDKYDAVSEYIFAVLGDQDIDLKASVPDVEKDIIKSNAPDTGSNYVKGDVAGVGDYVQFKLTGTLPKNIGDYKTYKYIFHDTLSKGLNYVNDTDHPLTVTVYASRSDADSGNDGKVVAMSHGDNYGDNYKGYTVTATDLTDGCNFEIVFEDLLKLMTAGELDSISVTAESIVVVTYWAKVTDSAVIGDRGNPNDLFLEFSNNPNGNGIGKTEKKTVYVYAFGLALTKVGSDTAHQSGLEGAGFVLKDEAGRYAIFKDQYTNAERDAFSDTKVDIYTNGPVRRLTGWAASTTVEDLIKTYNDAVKALQNASNAEKNERQVKVDEAKKALSDYLLMSGTDGAVPDVYGLDEGIYTLKEVITPDGYNTMADFDIKITAQINAATGKLESVTYEHGGESKTYNGTNNETEGMTYGVFHSGLMPATLINTKAPFMPFTGGIGTLIFYVLGGLMIAGAVIYLVIASRKRSKTE